jgi:hypothetical protein
MGKIGAILIIGGGLLYVGAAMLEDPCSRPASFQGSCSEENRAKALKEWQDEGRRLEHGY